LSRPDTLDPALTRPGRLDRKIEFSLPDLEVHFYIIVSMCIITLHSTSFLSSQLNVFSLSYESWESRKQVSSTRLDAKLFNVPFRVTLEGDKHVIELFILCFYRAELIYLKSMPDL